MKNVIDFRLYRAQKAIQDLEKKISGLALAPPVGSVREMKTCFKQWLKMQAR